MNQPNAKPSAYTHIRLPERDETLLAQVKRLTAEQSDSEVFLKALRLYADALGIRK